MGKQKQSLNMMSNIERPYIHRTWEMFKETVSNSGYSFGNQYPAQVLENYSKKSLKRLESKLGMKYEEAYDLINALEVLYASLYTDSLISQFDNIMNKYNNAKTNIIEDVEKYYTKYDISTKRKVEEYIQTINEFIYKFENMDKSFFSALKNLNPKTENLDGITNSNKVIYQKMSKAAITSLVNLKLLIDTMYQKAEEVEKSIQSNNIQKTINNISFFKLNRDKNILKRSKSIPVEKVLHKIQGYVNTIMGAYFEYLICEMLQNIDNVFAKVSVTGFETGKDGKQQKADLKALLKNLHGHHLNISVKAGDIEQPFEGHISNWGIHYAGTSASKVIEELYKVNASYAKFYKYVLYNSIVQRVSPSFDVNFDIKELFNLQSEVPTYVKNVLQHIAAIYTIFAIGEDIDFVLYRDRYLPVFVILRDISSMVASNRYIMQLKYNYHKRQGDINKYMNLRRAYNNKQIQENLELSDKIVQAINKGIPANFQI